MVVSAHLAIAFPDNAKVADDLDRCRTQHVIFLVRKGLRRCHNYRIAGMDTEGVKVLLSCM
jgi:hypothetical protein